MIHRGLYKDQLIYGTLHYAANKPYIIIDKLHYSFTQEDELFQLFRAVEVQENSIALHLDYMVDMNGDKLFAGINSNLSGDNIIHKSAISLDLKNSDPLILNNYSCYRKFVHELQRINFNEFNEYVLIK